MYPACWWDISIPGHNGLRARGGLTNGPAFVGCIFEPDFDRASIDCLPSLLSLADLLMLAPASGSCQRRDPIVFAARQHRPADPDDFIGQSNDSHVLVGPLLEAGQPKAEAALSIRMHGN